MVRRKNWLAALAMAATMHAAPALALADWSFVSTSGSDSNGCAITSPCRTFQGAYNKTSPGGTIVVLTPGSYGAVTITRGISIINDGVGTAAIFAPSSQTQTAAITISTSETVNLRGLTLDGDGAQSNNQGIDGIDLNGAYALNIENCTIRNFKQFGLSVGAVVPTNIAVSNTHFSSIGGYAVELDNRTVAGHLQAAFDHIDIDGGGFLVDSIGPANVVVTDSVSVNNTGGFQVEAQASAPVNLTLVRATAANDIAGLYASGATATLRVAQSTITGNQNGWISANGGVILSYGDNIFDSNLANQAAPPSAAKK